MHLGIERNIIRVVFLGTIFVWRLHNRGTLTSQIITVHTPLFVANKEHVDRTCLWGHGFFDMSAEEGRSATGGALARVGEFSPGPGMKAAGAA